MYHACERAKVSMALLHFWRVSSFLVAYIPSILSTLEATPSQDLATVVWKFGVNVTPKTFASSTDLSHGSGHS
jgi:hypothetical protein